VAFSGQLKLDSMTLTDESTVIEGKVFGSAYGLQLGVSWAFTSDEETLAVACGIGLP
jgi:hypothetical protein